MTTKQDTETIGICYHCGKEYDSDYEGHTHDPDCECWFCDSEHDEHDEWDGEPIRKHVKKHGYLNICSPECEDNFRRV